MPIHTPKINLFSIINKYLHFENTYQKINSIFNVTSQSGELFTLAVHFFIISKAISSLQTYYFLMFLHTVFPNDKNEEKKTNLTTSHILDPKSPWQLPLHINNDQICSKQVLLKSCQYQSCIFIRLFTMLCLVNKTSPGTLLLRTSRREMFSLLVCVDRGRGCRGHGHFIFFLIRN